MINWAKIDLDTLAFKGQDLCDHYAGEMGLELARKKDDLLRACITSVIGTDWTIASIAPRLSVERTKWSLNETWILDDTPLVEIWPAKSWTTHEDRVNRMHAGFDYRLYVKISVDSEPQPQ